MRLVVRNCPFCEKEITLPSKAVSKGHLRRELGGVNRFKIICSNCQNESVHPVESVVAISNNEKTAGGAVVGGILGLIGGPVGLIIGGVIGGAIGATGDSQERNEASIFNQSR